MANVVVFSGGRGSASIAAAASRSEDINLTLLINGYDDGLSTGVVRRLIPGMLGPSDFRKAISNICKSRGGNSHFIEKMLEVRLSPSDIRLLTRERKIENIRSLQDPYGHLSVYQGRFVERVLEAFFDVVDVHNVSDDQLRDMAFGNIVFGGAHIDSQQKFNDAVRQMNQVFCPWVNIFNVTDGFDLRLIGIKEDGTLLPNEESIVSHQSVTPIKEIFLVPTPTDSAGFVKQPENALLNISEVFPQPSHDAIEALRSADAIIYGPGTQHSSLFPSYLTTGIQEAISLNTSAEKVLVANIAHDHDLGGENLATFVDKFYFYMSRKTLPRPGLTELVTQVLIQPGSFLVEKTSIPDLSVVKQSLDVLKIQTALGNWSDGAAHHDGDRVLATALKTKDANFNFIKRVRIVVPVLNEAPRIGHVLEGLAKHDWLADGYLPNFVVVDGGSTDGSCEIVESVFGFDLLQLPAGASGIGAALAHGMRGSTEDFVVSFPSDGEYTTTDLRRLLDTMRDQGAPIVFGSRTGFCVDSKARLREIYEHRKTEMILSYYGGTLLSLLSLLRFRRSISDPLTSVKGFSREAVEQLTFSGNGLEWHVRLIRDAANLSLPVAEIPVAYTPRSRSEGKKTSVFGGARAVLEFFRSSK